MGADLCVALVAHRNSVQPSWQNAWLEIDRLTPEDIALLGTEAESEWDWEHIDFDNLTPKEVEAVRETLKSWIRTLVETLDSREVTALQILGWWIYITGGMTWGDDPTETFTEWCKIDNWGSIGLKIYQAAGLDYPPSGPEQYIVQEEALP